MEKVNSRNQGQMETQGQEVKKPVMMPIPENTEGKESGVSNTAGAGTVAGYNDSMAAYTSQDESTLNSTRDTYLNIPASSENRSAKWKNGESINRKAGVPAEGDNQYQ